MKAGLFLYKELPYQIGHAVNPSKPSYLINIQAERGNTPEIDEDFGDFGEVEESPQQVENIVKQVIIGFTLCL